MEISGQRSPGSNARARAGPVQIDRAARTRRMAAAVGRKMLLMRAPPQFGGLRAFTDETVDRPGIDEFIRLLRLVGDLRIAFGHVNDFDAERHRELGPFGSISRRAGVYQRVRGDVQQRLLDQVRHHAGVRAVRQYRRRRRAPAFAQGERLLAHRIIAALLDRQRGVGVAARPWLYAGVEIQRPALARELDQSYAGNVHRQVQQEIAFILASARASCGSCLGSARA